MNSKVFRVHAMECMWTQTAAWSMISSESLISFPQQKGSSNWHCNSSWSGLAYNCQPKSALPNIEQQYLAFTSWLELSSTIFSYLLGTDTTCIANNGDLPVQYEQHLAAPFPCAVFAPCSACCAPLPGYGAHLSGGTAQTVAPPETCPGEADSNTQQCHGNVQRQRDYWVKRVEKCSTLFQRHSSHLYEWAKQLLIDWMTSWPFF